MNKKTAKKTTKAKVNKSEVINNDKKVLVKITNLVKTYGKFNATDGITLTINKGESVAITGDNGGGKTTLVEQIAGIKKPTSGTIEYFFENGTPQENIGMQFQSGNFPTGLKVKHLLNFYKDILGNTINKDDVEVHIKNFKLEPLMNREINSLSGGQKQRLNILISIMHHPSLVILDEVSTGLDIGARYRFLNYIKELKEKYNWTIIIVSHSNDEISELADRVVVLNEGKVVDDHSMSSLEKRPGALGGYLSDYFRKDGEI